MTTTIPSTIEPNLNNDLESNVKKKAKKLTLLPLIFLIYFEVSGGPFGEEPAVKGAGPFYALLGFIIFPFIWSIPEALVTAELATAYPGNGGYVIWAERAFGPFWGSVMGSWKYLSGVINNASYSSLCNSYLVKVLPIFDHGWYKNVSIAGFSIVLSILNYFGLNIVGYLAMAITVFSLSPFLILFGFAVPKFKPQRWLSKGQPGVKKKWTLFFNTLFWNLNFWDNASTLAGEVENPQKTFPTALFAAGLLTCIGYLIPLIATTGALPLDQEQWDPGYLADAADLITGNWLKIWVQIAAFFSTIGLFEAQLSSSSYQLLGMADLGFMPKFFTKRSRFNTPWVGILVSTIITLAMSYLPFEDVISSANFLYLVAMLLEFAAFVWLRKIKPSLKRPYRVPMRIPGLILMLTLPTGFMIFIAAISKHAVLEIGGSLIVFGILMYFFVNFCKSKKCFEFSTEGSLPEDVDQDGVQLENRT